MTSSLASRLRGMGMAMLVLMASMPIYATPTYYIFDFQTEAVGQPVPTGGLLFDSDTGLFSDFIVVQSGTPFDFTAEANRIGGNSRLPFELGHLAQNLIDGFGPLGPEFSHWYAGAEGFYGFEWRTPAADFLTVDLTIGAPADPISRSPRAFAGTWRTTAAAPTPEPATLGMMGLALTAGAAAWGRKRRRLVQR